MMLSSVERGVAVALSVGGGEASHVVDWLEQAEVEQGTSAAAITCIDIHYWICQQWRLE